MAPGDGERRAAGQHLLDLAPVADDGLFLAQTAPSREGTITVEATRGQRSKTLVRKFKVALPQADPK